MPSSKKLNSSNLWQIMVVAVVVLLATSFWGYRLLQKTPETTYFDSQLPQTQAPAKETPEQAAEAIYDWYRICLDEHFKNPQGSPDQDCPYQNSRHISPNLALNSNLFCSQNVPQRIEVEKLTEQADQSEVQIRSFYNQTAANPIQVTLQYSEPYWKITSVKCNP